MIELHILFLAELIWLMILHDYDVTYYGKNCIMYVTTLLIA